MELQYAVVHDLKKEIGKSPEIRLRTGLLQHSESLLDLFKILYILYNEKSAKGLGRFHKDTDVYQFSVKLDEFVVNNSEESFLLFTRSSMNILKDRVSSENLATGGYVLFIYYTKDSKKYLFITILKQTKGCAVTDDLNISEAQHLEVDKIRTGCQISFDSWKEDPDSYFITFIKGRLTTTTPQYFLKAIGCDEFADSVHQTNELIRAVNDYAASQNFSTEKKQEFKQLIYSYCQDKDNIYLEGLSNAASEDEPEKFLEFINAGNYKIGNGFEPNSVHLKKLKEIKAKGEGIQLSFPASMLGTRVQLNETNNLITINNPPASIVKTLKDELGHG